MRTLIFTLLIVLTAFPSFARDTYVRGYTRSDGSYVSPHYRTAPDGNSYNNYTSQGMTNPYTGQAGTRNPYDSYSPSSGSNYNNNYDNPYDPYD